MPSCIVDGCTSKKSKHNNLEGIILHVFPPNIDRIKIWLRQTGQDFGDLDAFAEKVLDAKKHDTYRLCSAHFTPQCYIDHTLKKTLRHDALPTIFNKIIASGPKRYRRGIYRTRHASTQTHPWLSTNTMKKSSEWKERSHVVIDPHRIDEIRAKFTERVLDLATEIICLLTREDNAVGKKTSGEHVTADSHPQMSEGCTTTQSPDMETPPPSLTPETNYKNILEVTNNINELLTGEVPITFQDVIVYFSMEESEYIEGPKDFITEDPQSQGAVCEVEVEVNDEQEEPCVKADETRMDVDIPPEINKDPEDTKTMQSDIEVKKEEEGHVRIKEEEIPKETSTDPADIKAEEELRVIIKEEDDEQRSLEINTDPEDIIDTQRDIKVYKEEKRHEWVGEEEIPPEISRDGSIAWNNREQCPAFCPHDETVGDNAMHHGEDLPSNPHIHEGPSVHNSTLNTDYISHRRGKLFPCSESGEFFVQREERSLHQEGQGEETPYSCSMCGKCFSQKAQFIRHYRTHSAEKPFSCSECGKSFKGKTDLTRHQRTHTGEKPFPCPECGRCFAERWTLANHKRIHSGEKPFSCSECGKGFIWRGHLISHLRTHTGEKPFSCSNCGKCFAERSTLASHQRIHSGEKPYSCSECDRCFANKESLIVHQRTHTGVKPYSCLKCGKCFTQKGNLRLHQKTHAKTFSCSECAECFSERSAFKDHLLLHQTTRLGEKPYSCSECGKCFAERSTLGKHLKTHLGLKPFSCSECGRCFTRKESLISHQKTHTGEKPFACPICGKCFAKNSNLAIHQRIHSGEKPFSCPRCGKCFSHKSTLKKHRKVHVGEIPVQDTTNVFL